VSVSGVVDHGRGSAVVGGGPAARGRPGFAGCFGFDGIVAACTPSAVAGSPVVPGPLVVSDVAAVAVPPHASGNADRSAGVPRWGFTASGWCSCAGPRFIRTGLIGSDLSLRLATGPPPSLHATEHPVAKPLQKLLHMRPAGAMLPICPHLEWQEYASV